MDLRFAVEDDLPGILAIYNHAITTTTAVFHYRPHTLEMQREWFKEKAHKGFPVIVAVEAEHVIGFATYGPFRPWPAYKYTVEHSVYVHEEFRGKGVGRTLISELLNEARRRGAHTMIGGVVSDNAVSLRMHERLGFVEAGRVREVGYKFGRWLDLVFMQIVLETPSEPRDG